MLWHAHLTALLCASINPQDALDEIARQKPKDLFKPLRVHFIGEDGIDAGGSKDTNKVGAGHSSPWTSDAVWAFSLLTHVEQDAEPPCKPRGPITLALPPFSLSPPNHFPSAGGVKKEFFQLLVTELLCPDYGMLIYQPESRTYWFNPTTLEADAEFLLLGLVRQGWGLVAVARVVVGRGQVAKSVAHKGWPQACVHGFLSTTCCPPHRASAGAGPGHLQRRAAGLPAAAGAVPQDPGAGGEAARPGGHAAHAGQVGGWE